MGLRAGAARCSSGSRVGLRAGEAEGSSVAGGGSRGAEGVGRTVGVEVDRWRWAPRIKGWHASSHACSLSPSPSHAPPDLHPTDSPRAAAPPTCVHIDADVAPAAVLGGVRLPQLVEHVGGIKAAVVRKLRGAGKAGS